MRSVDSFEQNKPVWLAYSPSETMDDTQTPPSWPIYDRRGDWNVYGSGSEQADRNSLHDSRELEQRHILEKQKISSELAAKRNRVAEQLRDKDEYLRKIFR